MSNTIIHQQHGCLHCSAATLCLPAGLGALDIGKLESIVQKKRLLQKGEILFCIGEEFNYFYAIASGALKHFSSLKDGREQIHGFYLAGEIIGFDAVDAGTYDSFAEALIPTKVCLIPFEQLMEMAHALPKLQKQVIRLMSHRLRIDMHLPHNSSATERIASFLLNISARLSQSNYSMSFAFPMSRAEIANHLGLATETVSRIFSQFQDESLIDAHGKQIHIKNFDALKKLACA